MNYLFFKENYNNKLKCEVLTTIRLEDEEKFKIGNRFELRHKVRRSSINHGIYVVIDHRILRQQQITNWITQLDCAMDADEFKQLMYDCYPSDITTKTRYSIVLLKRVREEDTQQSIF